MKKIIYCDMDGVLADFAQAPRAIERFATEKGFFKYLNPIAENVNFIRYLIQRGESVYILSASPNKQADKDKREWLAEHLPEIKRNRIILMRNGQKKIDFVKTKSGILLDDYGRNCREWAINPNYQAFQVHSLIAFTPLSKLL